MNTSDPDPLPPAPVAAIADYISDLSKELAGMARHARLDLLAYLLEMASDEAKTHRHDHAPTLAPDKSNALTAPHPPQQTSEDRR